MSQKIHYQDDLFLLSVLVKALDTSMAIEADPDFFAGHAIEEIVFLDARIGRFHEMLSQNSHLIERPEYLKLLEGIVKGFVSCLRRIPGMSSPASLSPMAMSLGERASDIAAALSRQEAILAELGGALDEATGNEAETDLVSSDELSELLR
jgi:hypothetical protein